MAFGGIQPLVLFLAAFPCAAQTEAEKLIEAGHWKRARALAEASAKQHPNDALNHFLLSQIGNAFGDRESPLPQAEMAVTLDGSVAKYHRQVAEVTGVPAQHAGILQQIVLARRFQHEIEIALQQDPSDLQALRDLIEFYLLAPRILGGDREKSREVAARISRLDAVQGFAAQARLAEAGGDTLIVGPMLDKAVQAGPSNYRARIALASFCFSHGDMEQARKQAEAAAGIDGSRVDAFSLLAAVYARSNQIPELEGVLATAAKQVPDDLLPYYRAGEVLLSCGRDLDRAQRYFRRYLSQEPEGSTPTLLQAREKLNQLVSAKRGKL